MSDGLLIQVNDLSRYYADIRAVHNVSFNLKKGEVLGFLGPNGAGKSSTMQMISGNLAPSSGEIIINGIDMLEQPKQAKASMGYLPENPPIYTDLSVDEYLSYCAKLHAVSNNKVSAAVDTARERCGLKDTGKRVIGHLSKGYQQRVGIAQAIIHQPNVVILDEPTVGLDPIQIREIRKLITQLGEEHSVILSTHILSEVQAICTRVQIIHQGELTFSDSIENMNQRMHAASLKLAFSNHPTLEELTQIDGVISAEHINTHYIRIHFDPDNTPIDRLVSNAVHKNWGLQELTPEFATMEDIFVALTEEKTPPKTTEALTEQAA